MLFTVLLALCLAAMTGSAAMAILFLRALRRVRWMEPAPEGEERSVLLSVVVPARNEERDLADSLSTILAQEGLTLEVIVVNDHSTDGTGAILRDLAAADPRLKGIHDPPLKPGWLGKQNAMQRGAEEASGDLLLFCDADILHAPGSFRAAVAHLVDNDLDFLSLIPRYVFGPFWEHVLAPVFMGAMGQFVSPGAYDTDSEEAFASGAFMMVRRSVFFATGGFDPIRDQVLDDLSFALHLKKARCRVEARFAPRSLEVHMFKTNAHAFRGIVKNILGANGGKIWPIVPLPFIFALLYWTPILAASAGTVFGHSYLAAAGAATYFFQYAVLFLGRPIARFRPLPFLAFPLLPIVLFYCVGAALYHRMRNSVSWRGRIVKF